MRDYIKKDPWNIIEEGFDPALNRISESIFSIGNGRMGQRANFEEKYSGSSLRGSYVAGVYYPDKTRVGWWKNGYPEYFAKVLNATNWIGIHVNIEGEELDLASAKVTNFKRVLNMQEGLLQRSFVATLPSGKQIEVQSTRFTSIVDCDNAVIRYAVRALNFSGKLSFVPLLDLNVVNQDSNYDEQFWVEISRTAAQCSAAITGETKKTAFHVACAFKLAMEHDGDDVSYTISPFSQDKLVGNTVNFTIEQGQTVSLIKYVAVISSLYADKATIQTTAEASAAAAYSKGYATMLKEQRAAWAKKWAECDITIEGDVAAQQAIRFNILQMNQTYTGEDERLNIGPKGFTGEKYGGVTYWDTEAYCLPFYLKTADPQVARQLLIYRYKHLGRAIENATKLGFKHGAALYPMVTINGEECHNEWEITFEEIHRNGAMSFAIYNYINHTGDVDYLAEYGLEVLIAISRFWRQRVQWSERRKGYVMLGVTGPNEYENNVNNNWYTNLLAQWTLNYTRECLALVKESNPVRYTEIAEKTHLGGHEDELSIWADVAAKIVLPRDNQTGVFIQHDGFMDKELLPMTAIPQGEYPIHKHWSWDRILRSCYIKQADVLQGIYTFEANYDKETLKRNFDFYEPLTVHESSLSPCIHSILASSLGYEELAYKFYLRTARLDLDDYNHDTDDGLHITSMAGTWMAVVEGFGGVRVREGGLQLNPSLPKQWQAYSFRITFRKSLLKITVKPDVICIENESDVGIELAVYGQAHNVLGRQVLRLPR
ncbi:family 65 glycosyl hydrolase domain-containing protein [Undibacterium fentianense]|uniref:Glycoside hydrolase family 65 protein n=1 Tax=Undibacterium fentianense TaxID=2828728 RepID=A0A941IHM3_9BURK|nr:family 65 glycosyl hydrolase domain-containing protein [Undibacterium fentianense]MBR7801120.1 glycoside hydrolase family 65 protein [Undibacterium fentianense]